MEHGRIVEQGTHDDARQRQRGGLYARLARAAVFQGRRGKPAWRQAHARNAGSLNLGNGPRIAEFTLGLAEGKTEASMQARRQLILCSGTPRRSFDVGAGNDRSVLFVEADGAGIILVDQQLQPAWRNSFRLIEKRHGERRSPGFRRNDDLVEIAGRRIDGDEARMSPLAFRDRDDGRRHELAAPACAPPVDAARQNRDERRRAARWRRQRLDCRRILVGLVVATAGVKGRRGAWCPQGVERWVKAWSTRGHRSSGKDRLLRFGSADCFGQLLAAMVRAMTDPRFAGQAEAPSVSSATLSQQVAAA